MFDYDSLKATAKSIGRSVRDLLALSPDNDPFFSARPSRCKDAEWFATLWAAHGTAGFHLRRLHYLLISLDPPPSKPDGEAYTNTTEDWKFLARSSLSARYLDLIPPDALIDRRNTEALLFAEDVTPAAEIKVTHEVVGEEPYTDEIAVPEMPLLPLLNLNADVPGQKYICEIWIEKSSQNDWLVPLCEARGVNLVAGIGESSEVRSRELALRAHKCGAPVRILYLSDLDPAGRGMPKSVARKVEFTVRKLELDVDIKLIPLALSPDQCREYRLPRIPIKETERRAAKFEGIFGEGATELDAMEALFPGEMARLIHAELDCWLDRTLPSRFAHWKSEQELRAWRITRDVRGRYEEEVEEAAEKFQAITDRLEEVLAEFATWESDSADLWSQIASDLADQELETDPVPESNAPGTTDNFVLYDSERDYLSQMDAYNAWRDGDEAAS